jgi:hypothetical protein
MLVLASYLLSSLPCRISKAHPCHTDCISVIADSNLSTASHVVTVPVPPHISPISDNCVCENNCGKSMKHAHWNDGLCSDGGPHSVVPAWEAKCPLGHDW